MTGIYLQTYLAPLEPWLARPDVTDILVNRAGELWIEESGGTMTCVPAPNITETALLRLARQIAAANHQGVNREQPLLSATLPNGARVQIIAPPATRDGLALAIRKHTISNLSLDELAAFGVFARASGGWRADNELSLLLDRGDLNGLLKAAVRHKQTIVISGGYQRVKASCEGGSVFAPSRGSAIARASICGNVPSRSPAPISYERSKCNECRANKSIRLFQFSG